MREIFLFTLSPMLVMFICLLIGFMLNKARILPKDASTVMARLETYVFMPCLGFSTFMKYCTVESLKANKEIFIFSLVATTVAFIIAIPLSRAFENKDSYKRNIYKYALVFANHGFMGNAIVPLIFGGSEHLYKYLLLTLPLNFTTYLWGIRVLTPPKSRSKNIFSNIINPPMIGLVLGVVAGLTGFGKTLPGYVITSVDSLQQCMGPVAMLLSGFIIGNYKITELLGNGKVYIATFLRLIILPVIILTVLYFCGASNYILMLALIAYATPLGLNTIVIPAAYGGETKTGAGMTMISTVLCTVTIPFLFSLLEVIIGKM